MARIPLFVNMLTSADQCSRSLFKYTGYLHWLIQLILSRSWLIIFFQLIPVFTDRSVLSSGSQQLNAWYRASLQAFRIFQNWYLHFLSAVGLHGTILCLISVRRAQYVTGFIDLDTISYFEFQITLLLIVSMLDALEQSLMIILPAAICIYRNHHESIILHCILLRQQISFKIISFAIAVIPAICILRTARH